MRTRPTAARDRLAVALDVDSEAEALALAEAVAPHAGVVKVGLELFTTCGPSVVRSVHKRGLACFLDLKLHDIPATMAKAAAAAAALGVRYLTVHASAGPRALRAVHQTLSETETLALTVTTLTSLDADELGALGIEESAEALTRRYAKLALEAGARGFVCSALEAGALRRDAGAGAVLVTPGIRPDGSPRGDQRRVATPREAIAAGADVIVVGRPIRTATDPAEAARLIALEIEACAGPA